MISRLLPSISAQVNPKYLKLSFNFNLADGLFSRALSSRVEQEDVNKDR
jgi:hypothetical protein